MIHVQFLAARLQLGQSQLLVWPRLLGSFGHLLRHHRTPLRGVLAAFVRPEAVVVVALSPYCQLVAPAQALRLPKLARIALEEAQSHECHDSREQHVQGFRVHPRHLEALAQADEQLGQRASL